jgi:hypothetical protein
MIFFPFFGGENWRIFFTKRNIVAIYSLFNSIFRILAKFCTDKKNAAPNHELLGFEKKKNALFHTLETMFFNRQIYPNFQPEKSDLNLYKGFCMVQEYRRILFFFSTFIISHA